MLYTVLAEWSRQAEVAVDAAPHLSGVAAVRPGKGGRQELSEFVESGGRENW